MTTEYVPLSSAFEEIHRRYFFFKTKNKGEMDMKNNDSLKRIKAMAEALAKIQKAQDEQKAMQAISIYIEYLSDRQIQWAASG